MVIIFGHDFDQFPELTNSQLDSLGYFSPHPQIVEDFSGEVVKVHDGDTVTLRTNFRDFDFPLRLLDIDSFELNAGGEEAKLWLKNKIEGQAVSVQIDSSNRVGKYGRLLGRILHAGSDVGEEQLHLGLALPFGAKSDGMIPHISFWEVKV